MTRTLSSQRGLRNLYPWYNQPFFWLENGKILFYMNEETKATTTFALYDPQTDILESYPIDGIHQLMDWVTYSESLVSPNAWYGCSIWNLTICSRIFLVFLQTFLFEVILCYIKKYQEFICLPFLCSFYLILHCFFFCLCICTANLGYFLNKMMQFELLTSEICNINNH